MAKTTVFSWKITDNSYGYLWTNETNGPCIRSRITDSSILEDIVGEISGWNEETYAENFQILSNLVYENFGNYIEGDYTIYYNGNNEGKSFILLTGKDGKNANSQGNSDISDSVLAKLKSYINNQFFIVENDIKSKMYNLKAETNQKIEVLNSNVNEKIDNAKKELVSGATIVIDSKITEIANGVRDDVLTKIENDIPISILQELINGTKIQEIETFVDEKTRNNEEIVKNIKRDVINQNERINGISNSVDEGLRNTNSRIDAISDEVSKIDTKIEHISSNKTIQKEVNDEFFDEINLRSVNNTEKYEDSFAIETETIDNGDGTFDIVITVGNDVYNVKILAFGNKLKSNDKTNGFVLASNGMKYSDKSGSSFSIINGNIKLSNNDGSGKLEIKKDGLYINGIKY